MLGKPKLEISFFYLLKEGNRKLQTCKILGEIHNFRVSNQAECAPWGVVLEEVKNKRQIFLKNPSSSIIFHFHILSDEGQVCTCQNCLILRYF